MFQQLCDALPRFPSALQTLGVQFTVLKYKKIKKHTHTHTFQCKHLIKAEPHFCSLITSILHLHSLTRLLLEFSLAFTTAVTLASIKLKYVQSKTK